MRPKNVKFIKKNKEIQGTYKIGGENRQIKRKNPDEQYDKMNLNPTRIENYHNNLDFAYLGNEQIIKNRARSQGYNIINHEIFNKTIKNLKNNLLKTATKLSNNSNNNNQHDFYSYQKENKNKNENENIYSDEKYANLYEEYLKKISEENKSGEAEDQAQPDIISQKQMQMNNSVLKYQNKNKNYQPEENKANIYNLPLYNTHMENNSNLLYKKPTYKNATSQEENFTKENKLDKQRAYRELLHQQVKININK
jgi:hypothetical protein